MLQEEEEKPMTYSAKAVKIWEDYEETVFNLSESSANETIESIKRMTLGQRLKFQQFIIRKNKPKPKTDGN